MCIRDRAKAYEGISVFAGVGERTREGNDLLREMIESGVIKYGAVSYTHLRAHETVLDIVCRLLLEKKKQKKKKKKKQHKS